MSGKRPSVELPVVEPGKNVEAARALQARLQNLNVQLVNCVAELNAHQLESEEGLESEEMETKDPAIVAMEVADQIIPDSKYQAYLRKLKFQYLEQNAKDKYVKSIVSDIDDAPIVTAEQNKELSLVNEEKKEKLKAAKNKLADVHNNIRLLAPMVEQDYQQVRAATERAATLSQKIMEARTSLMLLRQTHPQPRLTIPLADDRLAEQVEEMQSLSDQIRSLQQKVKAEKQRVKSGAAEVENLRVEAAEAEKAVKTTQVEEEDSRLVPLYDWQVYPYSNWPSHSDLALFRFTASLSLQRSICNLEDSHAESENELRLTYKIDMPSPSPPHRITIALIFAPDTRRLAAAQVSGLDELGIEPGDVVDAHVQVNDVHGLVAAILARARTAAST
ncbi:hypothetical protein CVT26_008746 [Gymnopilus dilepis]|uniref:Kinetochore protein Sos7 coiled-coil domain-containing protein n=1 Tax=Gymnopilus dilepis TaxID=231916 RepID=A0A409YG49_9AGAR|nr:hypothetical protein CVT26_008746 [Gymnopilus dilepis]